MSRRHDRRAFPPIATGSRRARAGGRRRDARPLLVRRRRAHLARGAGAGGQDRAHRGAARAARPTSRATSPRWARRRRCSRWSATTRPARTLAAPARGEGVQRVAAPRRRAVDHGQAARHRPPAAAAAHRFRDAAVARGAGRQARRVTSAWSATPTSVILSDYGKGGLAHIATMIDVAPARRASRCWSIPKGDDYRALSRRHAAHAQPRRVPRRSSGAGATRRTSREGAQALRARARPRGAARHAHRGGHDALHAEPGASTIPAQAREVLRRVRRRRHGDRHARRAAGRRRALPDAMRIANEAAGIVVGKLGTAVVQPDELA